MATKKKQSGTKARNAATVRGGKVAKTDNPSLPLAQTIVYVHGIGNKPPASVLKTQWDMALFEFDLGERSRMAYWVDRDRYPVPEKGSDTGADYSDNSEEAPRGEVSPLALREGWSLQTEEASLEKEITDLVGSRGGAASQKAQRKVLGDLGRRILEENRLVDHKAYDAMMEDFRGGRGDSARRIRSQRYGAAAVEAKILDIFPPGVRRWFTRRVTRTFLRDVNDFFFEEKKSQRMRETVRERLRAGGAPFVVIGHSQGSMIAYSVLMEPEFARIEIPLFITIGSPLGITEVMDAMKKLTGHRELKVPPCVRRWENIADPLDPVALDKRLRNEYKANAQGVQVVDSLEFNADSPRHPHSGTGYLSLEEVRKPVRKEVDTGLFQPVSRFKIARDVYRDFEDMGPEHRQKVLLQVADFGESKKARRETYESLVGSIEEITKRSRDDAALRLDELDRFVSVSLTRAEAETLSSRALGDPKHALARIWKNAAKWALVDQSIHTTQAFPAHRSYESLGKGVTWAVLDSGIHRTHPHFKANGGTIEELFDCTRGGKVRPLAGTELKRADDDYGHGAHVSGIIAGRHKARDRQGVERVMSGMAPDAKLMIYKVLDDNGFGDDAWIIKAIDHIYKTNEEAGKLRIHGVNLSLGGEFDASAFNCGYTPLCEELRRLWNQGVVVVIAAGNEGHAVLATADGDSIQANMPMSIGDPGNLEDAIVVGSTHRESPLLYGTSYFSSRGPTADGRMKPDCVAPGERIYSVRNDAPEKPVPNASFEDLYVEMSGTSMAAPHVSGLIAAFLSKRQGFIGRPTAVKEVMLRNCTDLGRQHYLQGAGMPNLVRMLMSV